ncbi:MAG: alpha/beta fold hydrolase, partial [Chloroflexota bacterium]
GEGPPVLLLHGWGAEIALVWPLAQRLIPLGYRVYAPDLPGFGETAEPPQPWSVYDYAQFVVTYMDYHSLGRAHMFGHSFGGRLGLILGAEHPDRLISMALADAAGLRKPPPLTARARLRLYKGVRDGLKAAGLGSLSDRLRGWYNHRYGSSDFNATTGIMRETFVQVVNEDLRDHARRVAVPVLLIWGDADADTPLWQAQELERLIPDAGLMTYPGAGHYSYLEHPVQTARAMHALFKG